MADARHHRINYVELPLKDADATKHFYGTVFGWTFQDWGPDYLSFHGAGLDGGFDRTADASASGQGALVVLYSDNLEATEQVVRDYGAMIVKPIFSFPGGRRFQFIDPNGNELAVWSE